MQNQSSIACFQFYILTDTKSERTELSLKYCWFDGQGGGKTCCSVVEKEIQGSFVLSEITAFTCSPTQLAKMTFFPYSSSLYLLHIIGLFAQWEEEQV